jgi:hypothetical protein
LPIAGGHALAIAMVVVVVGVLRALVDFVVFGLYRLLARRRGRVGMQVDATDLMLWSFLMATAHGAGLMLTPVLLKMPIGTAHHEHSHAAVMASAGGSVATGLAAVGIHTLAMLAVTGAIGIAVYEWVGLAFLRRAWINLDLGWALALIGTGVIVLVSGLL